MVDYIDPGDDGDDKEVRAFYRYDTDLTIELNGQKIPLYFNNFELPDTDPPAVYIESTFEPDTYMEEWDGLIKSFEKREKEENKYLHFPKDERTIALLYTAVPKKDGHSGIEYLADTKGILIKGDGKEYYFLVKYGVEHYIIKIALSSSETKIFTDQEKVLTFPKDFIPFAQLEISVKKNIRPLKDVMSEIIFKSAEVIEENKNNKQD